MEASLTAASAHSQMAVLRDGRHEEIAVTLQTVLGRKKKKEEWAGVFRLPQVKRAFSLMQTQPPL